MNILITRPLIDAEDLMGKFFSLGHKIIHIPTLKISPTKAEFIDATQYNAFIFTSSNAIRNLKVNKQDKGKLFLKFGDMNEDAAVDGAELKAKQAGELERIKNRHETELEALTDKHEREQERIDGQKEKETADNAIKSKRDADRKKAEADADKKESYHMSTLNKLRKEK